MTQHLGYQMSIPGQCWTKYEHVSSGERYLRDALWHQRPYVRALSRYPCGVRCRMYPEYRTRLSVPVALEPVPLSAGSTPVPLSAEDSAHASMPEYARVLPQSNDGDSDDADHTAHVRTEHPE